MGRSLRFLLLVCLAATTFDPLESQEVSRPPIPLKEIYVPFEHFSLIRREHPDGVVMELSEYRALVRTALGNVGRSATPSLPPREVAIHSASYRGEIFDGSARFECEFELRVAHDDWVVCPLGTPLPSLGRVQVDGKPGWLIVEEDAADGTSRSVLLVKGRGSHTVELAFSLPIRESEERAWVEGPLIPAATAGLELRVPGRAEGRAFPEFLETFEEEEATRFRLSLGPSPHFRLEWQGRRGDGDNPVHLAAEHRVTFLVRPAHARFAWDANVSVARQKIDQLLFREPPGATVVAVEGSLLHSWERTAEGLMVLLKEPALGEVRLHFSGFFVIQDDGLGLERFEIGTPALRQAQSDRGLVAFLKPRRGTLALEAEPTLVELDPKEESVPGIGDVGDSPAVDRLFAFAGPVRLRGQVALAPFRFETRSSLLLRVLESSLTLRGFLQVEVASGKAYELALTLTPGWRLRDLGAAGGSSDRQIRVQTEGSEAGSVRIVCERAIDPEHPLELQLWLDYTPFGAERNWESRPVALALPYFAGAGRSRTDLGVSLHNSIYLGETELPGWRTLSREETSELELKAREERRQAARLVAGLTTEMKNPQASFHLVHRAARGEYRSVTHVLAAENAYGSGSSGLQTLRVRSDLRLAVVDRGIEALTFRHPPVPEGIRVILLGEGIKETLPDPAGGTLTARFSRPWVGTRQFRLEYEVPFTPGEHVAIPHIQIAGDYGSERFVILQSQGSVEVESHPGAGVAAVDVDELPDFAEPWMKARIIHAYRHRRAGDLGTLRTLHHDRAPVLAHLAREMTLHTVIGADGTSRTLAEFLLAYSREQSVAVELPVESRCLAVRVNGEPIRALRRESRRAFHIPLPARSHATVSILYERPDREQGSWSPPLGSWGTWREEGPVFRNIPVGETRWTIHHPEGSRWFVTAGNMRPVDETSEERVTSFAASFFGRVFTGRWPRFTVFESAKQTRVYVSTGDSAWQGLSLATTPKETQQDVRLAAQRMRPTGSLSGVSSTPSIPTFPFFGEGYEVEIRKFGGEPRVALSYVSFFWWRFAKNAVFGGTLVAALLLYLARRRALLRRGLGWGLFFGTLLPPAVGWESPLLLIPFSEALVIVALALLVVTVGRGAWRRVEPGAGRPRTLATSTGLLLVCVLVSAQAAADEKLANDGPGNPFGAVLIPYSLADAPWHGEGSKKVFLPQTTFHELWKLANPDADESEKPGVELPYDVVIGNSDYTLGVEDQSYRLRARVAVNVLTESWVTLSLPFDRAQLLDITLDGVEIGVAQHEGHAALELKGFGERLLQFELVGQVIRDLGEYRIKSRLFHGFAANVQGTLPKGSEVELSQSSAGTTVLGEDAEDGTTKFNIDLGGAPELLLTWSFPKVEGQIASQLESTSYSSLTLSPDGVDVWRRERLRVTGKPVARVAYRVLGNWEITKLSGADLAEWNVSRDDSGILRLTLFLERPVSTAAFDIVGRAVMATEGDLLTLSLEGAARQETFVGLHHGGQRRFLPDTLTGMQRTSPEQMRQVFAERGEDDPVRIYHAYGDGGGERLRIGDRPARVVLESAAVAWIQEHRLAVFVRTRYLQSEAGPLRHRVRLPDAWTVRKVDSNVLRSWEIATEPEGKQLVVDLDGRAQPGGELVWSAERRFDEPPERVELPLLRLVPENATARVEETFYWVVAADENLDLLADRTLHFEAVPTESAPTWVRLGEESTYRFAFRSRRGDAMLGIAVEPKASPLSATVVSFARIAQEALHVNSRIVFRARPGGRDLFHFQLPPGAELVYADTRNQKSQLVELGEERTDVTIFLQSTVAGDHPVDVVYRLPRHDDAVPTLNSIRIFDGTTRLPADQYVGVVQTERTFTLETQVERLRPVELESLPFLPTGISPVSLRPTYVATRPDWSLALKEEEIEDTQPVALIKLADISTVIGNDGTTRTRVLYTLVNESLQFLSLELPFGADLWSVTVNAKPVAVGRVDSENQRRGAAQSLKIPVEHVGKSGLPLEVALTYEEPPVDIPAMRTVSRLQAPRLLDTDRVKVEESIWSVDFPAGYRVTESAHRMRQAPPSQKHAEKLNILIAQQQAVMEAAQSADSRRARERAAQELARLEQALGDNLAELQGTNRSVQEGEQAPLVGKKNLLTQWSRNDQIIKEAQGIQSALKVELEGQSQRDAGAFESRDEQAFNDRANSLRGRDWGVTADQGALPPTTTPRGETAADRLLEKHPYRAWTGVQSDASPTVVDEATPTPVDARQGLTPLPETSRLGTAPGLRFGTSRPGYTTYTYHGSHGDAELTLHFTQPSSFGRLGAWVIMILVVGIYGWARHNGGAWSFLNANRR